MSLNKYKLLKFSLIPYFIREIIQRSAVTILLYHDLSPANARIHFSYLTRNYNIISLQSFLNANLNNQINKLPPKSLIITFDDGHKGNYDLLPIIKEFNLPVTIFLCSHIIDTNRHFWFKEELSPNAIEEFKQVNNTNRLKQLENHGFWQKKEYKTRQALNRDEINEMKKYVNFQSHSMFHPCLPHCSDAESEKEIYESKKRLKDEFNLSVSTFSYPNGDYSRREIDYLKRHGYSAGITCDLWFNSQKTDIFRLKRVDCNDEASIDELIVKVTGIYHFLKRLFFGRTFGFKEINQ